MIDPPDATVYAMWDGTNDLGNYAFIDDSQIEGTNLVTYTDCIYNQLHRIYDNGGRYFVLFNIAPLNLAPMYAAPPNDLGPLQYWPEKPKNHTLISYRMEEEVVTVNAIFDYRTPFAVEIKKRFPGASFAVYDVHGLVGSICRFGIIEMRTRTDLCVCVTIVDRHLQQPIRLPEWYCTA